MHSVDQRRRFVRAAVVTLAIALVASACGNRRPVEEALLSTEGVGIQPGEGDAAATGGGVSAGGGDSGAGLAAGDGAVASSGAADVGSSGAPAAGASSGGPADGATGAAGAGSTAGDGPARYDAGASDKQVKFASVSSLTGLFSDFLQPRGARAYFKSVNAQGGVNGRTINYVIYDDQWDVTRNAALTRQAFETDDAFAFVDNEAVITGQGGKAFVEANKIPVIGGDMGNLATWGVSPYYYPQALNGGTNGGRLTGRWAVEGAGCKRVAGLALGVAESRAFVKSAEKGMTERGSAPFVYYGEIGIAETDYTQYAAQSKANEADCVVIGGQTNFYVRFLRAAAQQDYDPVLILAESAYDPAYIEADVPNEGDFFVMQTDIKENASKNPAVARMLDNINRFEPGLKVNGWAIKSYVAGMLAVEALKRMGNDLTRANALKVLDAIREFPTGLTPPLSMNPGPKEGPRCGNIGQVKGKRASLVRTNYCL